MAVLTATAHRVALVKKKTRGFNPKDAKMAETRHLCLKRLRNDDKKDSDGRLRLDRDGRVPSPGVQSSLAVFGGGAAGRQRSDIDDVAYDRQIQKLFGLYTQHFLPGLKDPGSFKKNKIIGVEH